LLIISNRPLFLNKEIATNIPSTWKNCDSCFDTIVTYHKRLKTVVDASVNFFSFTKEKISVKAIIAINIKADRFDVK
jgi:hypothetical protein